MLNAFEAKLRHSVHIQECNDRTDDRDNNDEQGVLGDDVDVDRGDTRDDHQVESETADAVHLVIVDVSSVDHFVFVELVHDDLDEVCGDHAPDEVEAPGDGIEQRHMRPLGQEVEEDHDAECHGVRKEDQSNLDRQLVDGLAVFDLVGVFEILDLSLQGEFFLDQSAFAFVDVDIKNADDRSDDKADGGDRQTDASSPGKGIVHRGEVDVPGQSVSGSLSVSQRKKDAGVIEELLCFRRAEPEEDKRYKNAEHGLQHIGGAGDCAVLHGFEKGGLSVLFCDLQRHGNEADRKSVIGEDLHQPLVDQVDAESLKDQVKQE